MFETLKKFLAAYGARRAAEFKSVLGVDLASNDNVLLVNPKLTPQGVGDLA